jgi:hypothetical protein
MTDEILNPFLARAAALAESGATYNESTGTIVHDVETMGPPAVLVTADDDGVQYVYDHLTHFFNTRVYESICSLSQEDKIRYFELIKNHEKWLTQILGTAFLNSKIFLSASGVDNELKQEYRNWNS